MDWALRVSAIMGLVSGSWVLGEVASEPCRLGILGTGAYGPIDSLVTVWFFFIVGPLVSFIGALSLLLHDMNVERKGIVGFIAFVSSLPPLSLLLTLLAS